MRAVVVYESMFGNTHQVAEHIAGGLRTAYDVEVLSVGEAIGTILHDIELLVVGGPTHAHGLSRPTSRHSASQQAVGDDDLELEPGADGPGLREWFDGLPSGSGRAAAFDTRVDAPSALTGRASKGIARRLARHGFELAGKPESFLVDKENHLLADEAERAVDWGRELAARSVTAD